MRVAPLLLSLSGLGSAAFASDACPPRYEIAAIIEGLDCGDHNPSITPQAINEQGFVVGYMSCPLGPFRAFVWWGEGLLVEIAMPPEVGTSRAYDINEAGWIAGEATIPAEGDYAFLSANGVTTLLDRLPGATTCEARGINDGGAIVGWCRNVITGDPNAAVLWHEGTVVDLDSPMKGDTGSRADDINEIGQMTGQTGTGSNDLRAVIWSRDEDVLLPPIPDGFTSEGWALNEAESVVGRGRLIIEGGFDVFHAYLWADGAAVDLTASLDLHDGVALDINDDGVIVGQAVANRPFLWRDGQAWLLNELVVHPGGATVRNAYSINGRGLITGTAIMTGVGGVFGVVLRPLSMLVGDLTCDGSVAFDDLLTLLATWGTCACVADLDGNGVVDQDDLTLLLDNWRP
jgi:uncharacterized membrane protein